MKHLHDLSDEELAGVLERGLGALSPDDGVVDMESFAVLQTARHAQALIREEVKPRVARRKKPSVEVFADCCAAPDMMPCCAEPECAEFDALPPEEDEEEK